VENQQWPSVGLLMTEKRVCLVFKRENPLCSGVAKDVASSAATLCYTASKNPARSFQLALVSEWRDGLLQAVHVERIGDRALGEMFR
jgi:hypothetical protein